MKILIIDTYYDGFLNSFYQKNPQLIKAKYKDQKRALLSQSFGTSDAYSYYLKKLGHKAEELIVNDEMLQRKWASENDLSVSKSNLKSKFQAMPFLHKFLGRPKWVQEIVLAQIIKAKPDVVYVQNLSSLNVATLKEIKKHCKLLVGQIASPVTNFENAKQYDLILTSFPHFVTMFKKMKINSEYFKIGFDPRILKKVGKQPKMYDVTFIGSFSPYHVAGTKLLESVAREIPVHIWGQGMKYLSPLSPLRKNYHGEIWGLEMYKTLARSKIVLNRHISTSNKFANNMRLYESTGMGALLLTDDKKNLNEIFKVGDEIISYKNKDDLIKNIRYYLTHVNIQKQVAKSGQKRTLNDYTYQKRMKEMVSIVKKYINA
jgi:spore maturation protein CgeB